VTARGSGRAYTARVDLVVVIAIAGAAFAVGWLLAATREQRSSGRAEAERGEEAERVGARLATVEEDRRRMDLVLSSMREGVLLFDGEGRAMYSNPAADTHLGAVPKTIDALLPLGMREAARIAAARRESGSAEAEVGAPSRWLRGAAIPVGENGAVLVVIRDVTEARRFDAVRRDFVANASHELKTPAATIQAAAETIGTAAMDDPAGIVGDLLDLSRLESGSDLEEVVALDAVLRDEGERFEAAAREAGVELSVRSDERTRVLGSGRDLALLVRNLIDNAIRYTRPGGTVEVALCTDGGDIVLTVGDTGIGIPQRDLARVFERFYRVDRARSRETGGTGLGLSIVRHVVENHGGAVSVESELGRGTRFEVRLPAATVNHGGESAARAEPAGVEQAAPSDGPR
jgi:signal transduction histidine kinase